MILLFGALYLATSNKEWNNSDCFIDSIILQTQSIIWKVEYFNKFENIEKIGFIEIGDKSYARILQLETVYPINGTFTCYYTKGNEDNTWDEPDKTWKDFGIVALAFSILGFICTLLNIIGCLLKYKLFS
jgi:hypothetical protein